MRQRIYLYFSVSLLIIMILAFTAAKFLHLNIDLEQHALAAIAFIGLSISYLFKYLNSKK